MTAGSDNPRVSVLIATRDRADSLSRTLDALARLPRQAPSWEVLVVDNGSTDRTPEVIRAFTEVLPLVHLAEPSPGKNRALNRALPQARGELLVFTDDDCVPESGWLRELVAAADRWPSDGLFGGAVVPRFPRGTPDWLTRADFRHGRWAFSWHLPRPDQGPTSETPLGPNMMIRAATLGSQTFDPTIGPAGPDYAMGSEVELLLRLFRSGQPFIHVPEAVVHHVLRPDQVQRDTLLRRARRCGRGNARLFPGISNSPVFGIPLFQINRLVSAGLRRAMAPFRSQPARWVDAMDFHQTVGHVGELLRMRRQAMAAGQSYQHLFPRWSDLVGALRRRGASGLLVRVLAALLKWAIEVRRIRGFRAFRTEAPDPDARLSIKVFTGPGCDFEARAALAMIGNNDLAEVERRFHCGDSVAIARCGGQPVGYAWRASRPFRISEIDATLHLRDDEVLGYDGFVSDDFRGQGIIAQLDAAQIARARHEGRPSQLVFVEAGNRASIRSLERMGKRHVLTATRISLPPLKWSRLTWKGDGEVQLTE